MTAPDLIDAVVGFRQFRMVGSELWSSHAAHRWESGPLTARCRVADHPAPAKGCTCGLYARYTPVPRGATLLLRDMVGGTVALWGRIELHAHGMRAEHAQVLALALPLWLPKRRDVQTVAEALDVPAVPAYRLVAATIGHGSIVPRSMRPPDMMPNKRQAPGEPASAAVNAVADGLGGRPRR